MNELIKKINEHIKTLNPKEFPYEAIYWARVRCCSITEGVEWTGEDNPTASLIVEIVKASPDGNSLFRSEIHRFVSEQLPGETRPIFVICEW